MLPTVLDLSKTVVKIMEQVFSFMPAGYLFDHVWIGGFITT